MELQGTLPFRLISFFSKEHKITEWRWDQRMREILEFPWQRHHWFSSGLSDSEDEKIRGAACSRSSPNGRPPQEWLRVMHRSHEKGPGPFSICVHRPEVRSLSYAEVSGGQNGFSLEYFPDSPCKTEITSLCDYHRTQAIVPLLRWT